MIQEEIDDKKLSYSMVEVTDYLKLAVKKQWDLCEQAGIKIVRTRKNGGRILFYYTKEGFKKLIKAGNFVIVTDQAGEKYMVKASYLKKLRD